MKYFKSKLWLDVNSGDDSVKRLANEKWDKNNKLYYEYFETIKPLFTKKFLNTYLKNYGFHDFNISEIAISTEKEFRTNIRFMLTNGYSSYVLELLNVKSYMMNFNGYEYCVCGKLSWGYDEFEFLDNGYIKLNILCDLEHEFEMVFKKIRVGLIKTNERGV